jgi:eukaryotic-like serine/threonine-protein kinase
MSRDITTWCSTPITRSDRGTSVALAVLAVLEEVANYTLIRKLGEGGMGTVYEAVHTTIGRRAAIKVLHPDLARQPAILKRFFNEARAVNIISHPSLVGIYDFGSLPEGGAYIVMEYLEGETLGARWQRGGAQLVGDALRFARQIASALAATHARGIVHRDLKPDNVMVVPDLEAVGGERAKLLDFGIAKLHAHREVGGSVTQTGAVMGTPLYMSPEQCRGDTEVDGKADVYSMGAMLYHMLAGRPLFDANGTGAILAMQIYEMPVSLAVRAPALPIEIVELVMRLLAKDPAARPDMAQLERELARLGTMAVGNVPLRTGAGASDVTTLGSASGQPAPAAPIRRRTWAIAAALVTVVIATAVALYSIGEQSVERPPSTPIIVAPAVAAPPPVARALMADAGSVDAPPIDAAPMPKTVRHHAAAPLPVAPAPEPTPASNDDFQHELDKARAKTKHAVKVEPVQ